MNPVRNSYKIWVFWP